jgi:two-component system response regulator PrrA
LIIEDDLDARQLYSEWLRLKGCTVFTASDGRAGLNKALELRPDAVILDLAMPRVDGWTVLKHLRESSMTSQIAVVVVSAMPDTRDSAMYAGADAYLSKPCPPEVVYLQLRALIRLRSAAELA